MSILDTVVSSWTPVNDVLSADGNATDLSVSQRTYLTSQAAIVANANNQDQITIKKLTGSPTSPVNGLRFRCMSVTDTSVCTYNIYAGTLLENADCELSLLGTLSFTTGTQASTVTGYEMCSQLTITEGGTSASFKETTTADDDRIAETRIDFQGSDILVIVPTAVGADCKLLVKAY